MPDTLLRYLRAYWRRCRPPEWLFTSKLTGQALTVSCAQRVYRRAKQAAGIQKVGGIHGLRHAYATHLLAAGLPVHQLQHQLGHNNIQSTLRYVHWTPGYREGESATIDLIAPLGVDHG